MKRISEYQHLSTADLEALLSMELSSDDPAEALAILAELESRQKETESPDEAWNRFRAHYLPLEAPLYPAEPPRRTSLFRRLGLTAAAACLACMLAVQAGGTDILRTMIHWTGDALFVESPAVTAESSFVPDTEDAAFKAASSPAAAAGETVTCGSLEEALSLLSLEGWAPAALPEGYAFSSAEVETLSGVEALHVVYTNSAGELLQYSCRRYGENTVFSSVIMKDEAEVELLEHCGATFYFLSNGSYEGVVWMTDEQTEFHISGPVSREELKEMIFSMTP